MICTGLEYLTDEEAIQVVEQSDNLVAQDIVRRWADTIEQVEEKKGEIASLTAMVEGLRNRSAIEELESRLNVAQDLATDMERKAKRLEKKISKQEEDFALRTTDLTRQVDALQAQLNKERADRPATW